MAEATKTVEQWEVEKNVMILGDVDLKSKLTEEEFNQTAFREGSAVSVDHEPRIQFLKDNSYAVTRENMLDASLSAKAPTDES